VLFLRLVDLRADDFFAALFLAVRFTAIVLVAQLSIRDAKEAD